MPIKTHIGFRERLRRERAAVSAARENRNAVVGTREKDTKVAVCSGRLRRTTYLLALILALILMIPPFFPLLRHAEEIVIPTMPPTESRFEDSDYEEDLVKARDRQAEQLRQMEAQMAALKNENALLQAKIGEVSAESEAVRQAYDQIKAELAQAAEALEAAIKEYTEAVAESRAKFKEYTERLSAMFYLRRQSLLEVVLSAGDITGVYTCLRLRAIIARDDKKALDNLNSAVAVAESLRYAAENTKSEYEEYVRLKQKELTALEEGLAQLAEEKRTHDAQLLSRGDALEDLRNEHEGVQEDLDQFYADKAKYEEARRLLEKLREEKIAEKSSIAASRSESASIAESIRAAESSRAEESRIAESIRRSIEESSLAESRRISESIRLSEEESQNLSLTSDPAENSQSVVETTPNVGEDPTEPSRTTEEPYDPNRPQQMVWPLPAWSYISSAYGMRIHPISGRKAWHYGVDFAGPGVLGSPIVSVLDGVVIMKIYPYPGQATSWPKAGLGNYVAVLHDDGLTSIYGHMMNISVNEGDIVRQGDVLGTCGSTGASTGPHLHFELIDEVYGDPNYNMRINPMVPRHLGLLSK